MSKIFISYASRDKKIADRMCAQLEQAGLPCWIAPRDILPGEKYALGIIRGIDNCRCMVVVFSSSSNKSEHVIREVERAVGSAKIIIPFKIDDHMPTDAMDYFLKVAHWLEIKDLGLDKGLEKLEHTIHRIITGKHEEKLEPVAPLSPPPPQKWKISAALAVCAVTLIVLIWYVYQNDPVPDPEPGPKAKMLEALIQENQVLLSSASRRNIESTLNVSMNLPNRKINIKAWPEPRRSQFMEGDSIKLKITPDRDAYLLVYVHSMDGSSYLIYPNHLSTQIQKIKKDRVFTVGQGDVFELEIKGPFGVDIVQCIATTNKEEYHTLLSKHDAIAHTRIAGIDRSILAKEVDGARLRGIGVKGVAHDKTGQTGDSSADETGANDCWGEALILINTKAAK